jgi:hypothetical protein
LLWCLGVIEGDGISLGVGQLQLLSQALQGRPSMPPDDTCHMPLPALRTPHVVGRPW